jgi:hypothetical protein
VNVDHTCHALGPVLSVDCGGVVVLTCLACGWSSLEFRPPRKEAARDHA